MVAVRTRSSQPALISIPYWRFTSSSGKSWNVHMPGSPRAGDASSSAMTAIGGRRRTDAPFKVILGAWPGSGTATDDARRLHCAADRAHAARDRESGAALRARLARRARPGGQRALAAPHAAARRRPADPRWTRAGVDYRRAPVR